MAREPEDLSYDEQHLWLDIDGDTATIGISEYAQEQLGSILFVELPDLDTFNEGDFFICVESGKKDQDLCAPFDLEVTEVNEELEDNPEIINEDAIENWICKVKILKPEQLEELAEDNQLVDYSRYRDYTINGVME